MEAEPTDARMMRDFKLNEALEAHAEEVLDELSIQNQRLARIQEYEEAAVSRSDPFAAVIGMGNVYFQRIFEHFGEALLDELDRGAHTLEELREFRPEVRLLVNLRNAIETDLEVQRLDARQQAAYPHGMKGKKLDTNVATKGNLVPKRRMGNA